MTAQTIVEKVLSRTSGTSSYAGDTVVASPDRIMVNDSGAPAVFKAFHDRDRKPRFPDRVVLVADHFVPASTIQAAGFLKLFRDSAERYGLRVFDQGRGGIAHALLPERGLVSPGDLIIGTDSHTTTYGAYSAIGIGYGSTDVAVTMLEGELWMQVPESIRIVLHGDLAPFTYGKDVALSMLHALGQDGANYAALEFSSENPDAISMDDRAAICNMAAEAGAKAAVFEVDSLTKQWAGSKGVVASLATSAPDEGARYRRRINIDLSSLVPMVALPGSPADVAPVRELYGTKLDQAYLGNCANGTLSDLEQAAEVLDGRQVSPGMRLVIVPATQEIHLEASRRGLIDIFMRSGAIVSSSTCGACFGGHNGVLSQGERCIANVNRNYPGRMGSIDAEIYLANSAVVAASAVAGQICLPEDL